MPKETGYRIEHDSVSGKQILGDAHYGVQTLRAAENLSIIGLEMHPEFINSFVQIKKAAAITNFEVGRLDKKHADAIVWACNEIMSGRLHGGLIVDPIQGGAGISLSMNANEVIANRAIEILGGEKGDYSMMNPSGHVNYGQSTNDVFPSCGKLTAPKLLYKTQAELERLYYVLTKKSEEFNHVIKMGRTRLQDAVPIRLGREFHAYATAIRRDINRFDRAKEEMRHLNLGGTAIGTGLNANVKYLQRVAESTSLISGLGLVRAYDLINITQNLDGYVVCSRIAKSCATDLSKVCNDLRPISSGPRTRLGEVNLPAKQNGSSVMPGKVNPITPEVVNQIAFHAISNDMTAAMTAEVGQLELNVFELIILYRLFQPVETVAYAVHTLVDNYISGITANEQHYKDTVENSVGIITAVCPYVGYEKAINVAKKATWTGKSVRELAIRDKLLTKEQLDVILSPISMMEPGISGTEAVNKMGGL